MPGLSEDVLATCGKGRISARDYRDTLIPEALRCRRPTMRGIAATLSEQDMADLAAYYAGEARK
jgi:cytochrome c553